VAVDVSAHIKNNISLHENYETDKVLYILCDTLTELYTLNNSLIYRVNIFFSMSVHTYIIILYLKFSKLEQYVIVLTLREY